MINFQNLKKLIIQIKNLKKINGNFQLGISLLLIIFIHCCNFTLNLT